NHFWNKDTVVIEDAIDPRGNVRIRLFKEQIVVEVLGTDGNSYFEWESKRARVLMQRLCKYQLLSDPYHYADIAMELQKAQIALKSGEQYTQDKPLKIGNIVVE